MSIFMNLISFLAQRIPLPAKEDTRIMVAHPVKEKALFYYLH